MANFWKCAVALVLPAVLLTTAQAQERVVPDGTTVKLLLLRQKSVQEELKLSAAKTKEVLEFTQGQSDAARKAAGLAKDERREAFKKLGAQNRRFLASVLTEKQSKRLDQITMQFTALTQLTKAETARELKLTDAQQEKLKALQTKARKALTALLLSKDREGRNERFAKLRERTRTQILAVLTDDQKAKVREMAGAPFKGEIVFEEPE
jgi:hypothetical protein